MIAEMLEKAGIPAREARYADPPETPYAVWMDDQEADGPDGVNRLIEHDITIELYEPKLHHAAEAALEQQLSRVHWTKQPALWLPQIRRYQTVYEFSYTEKI